MRIGDVLRYGRPYDSSNALRDSLTNYFYATHSAGHKLALLESGINPIAKVNVSGLLRCPAILISSSPHKIGSEESPWQDFFDPDNGHIRYYGDNKEPGLDPALSPGNKALLAAHWLHKTPSPDQRKHAVPIVFFKRITYDGKVKGYVQFQGFGIAHRVELVTQHVRGMYFANYVFDFVVFSLVEESEIFDWSWITSRRDASLEIDDTLRLAPKSWKLWVSEGTSAIDKCRRRVSKLQVTRPDEQKPEPGSAEDRVLREVYTFYDNRKARFEALAASVASHIIDPSGTHFMFGWITPPTCDGGSDFIGRLDVGQGFAQTKLVVLGQAKCESPDRTTGGRDIARTVARLKRGWIGVYVTTGHFSEAVQREIIEDKYPIICINGLQVAKAVSSMAFEQGYPDIATYLADVDSNYDSSIQIRQPEEVLFL